MIWTCFCVGLVLGVLAFRWRSRRARLSARERAIIAASLTPANLAASIENIARANLARVAAPRTPKFELPPCSEDEARA